MTNVGICPLKSMANFKMLTVATRQILRKLIFMNEGKRKVTKNCKNNAWKIWNN